MINCAKTSISKLFIGVKMVGGFFKLFIGEEVNAQVSTTLLKFFHRRRIRRVQRIRGNASLHIRQRARSFMAELPPVPDAENK